MKILKISALLLLSFLALVAVAVGRLSYQEHERQAAHDSLRRYRAGQRRLEQRQVAICEAKRKVPLEPADSPPLRMDTMERSMWKSFNAPFPIHTEYYPLDDGNPIGKFVVEALIDEAGCVRRLKVLESPNRALDAATLATFEKWAFLPATRNHRPVRVIEILTINNKPDDHSFFRDIVVDEDGYPVSAS